MKRKEGNKRVNGSGSSGSQHELHSVARGTRRGTRDENGGTEGLSTPQLPPACPQGRLAPCAMLLGLPRHGRLTQGLRRAHEGLGHQPAALRPSWSFQRKTPQVETVAAPLPLRGTSQTDKPSRNAPAPPTADPQTRAGGKLGSLQTAPRNSPITDVG